MKEYKELNYQEKYACFSLYPKESLLDEDWSIRLQAYRLFGFTKEALLDKDGDVRLCGYYSLGFTEEAKHDEDWGIRLQAYRSLGFTEESLDDNFEDIRIEAGIYFSIKDSWANGEKNENKNYIY